MEIITVAQHRKWDLIANDINSQVGLRFFWQTNIQSTCLTVHVSKGFFMSDERLLSILCNWLKEYRHRTTIQLSSLKEELNSEPNSLNLRNKITEKERKLALITENAIENYQAFWLSLSPHTRRPCPLCFIDGKTSNLYALPEEHQEESVKCEVCKERFFFSTGMA